MTDKNTRAQRWLEEYQEFLHTPERRPPDILHEQLAQHVVRSLQPRPWRAFAKLSLIQVLFASLSLLVCPQFELGFAGPHGLDQVFLHLFGEQFHMVACGALFIGSGALAGPCLLRKSELAILRPAAVPYFLAGSSLALAVLLALGDSHALAAALLWLLGAAGTGVLLFRLALSLRCRSPHHMLP